MLVACNIGLSQEWQKVELLPGSSRHHPINFSLDGFGYLLSGSNGDPDFYKYDPFLDEWTSLPDFPGPGRGFGYGVSYLGLGYVGFGLQNGTVFGDLWQYDPTTETWLELSPLPGIPRYHPAMIAGNGKIWVGLGSSGNGNLNDWWEYDIITDSWEQQPDLPGPPRHHPFYFDINGEPYVGFGHGNGIFKDFYHFDHINDQWTRLADFPDQSRVAGTQFSLNGKGYILSGQGSNHNDLQTGEFWEYDPQTDEWTAYNPHPDGGRWAPGSFVINDHIYLMCGNQENFGNYRDMYKARIPSAVSSTQEVTLEDNLVVSPNPATDFFSIDIESLNVEVGFVKIIDMQGKELAQFDFEEGKVYSLQTIQDGLYFVQILDQNNRVIGLDKLMKSGK